MAYDGLADGLRVEEEALRERLSREAASSQDLARALTNVAIRHFRIRAFGEAERLLSEAWELVEDDSDTELQIVVSSGLGRARQEFGRFRDAFQPLLRSAVAAAKLYEPTDSRFVKALTNLGGAYLEIGRLREAVAVFRKIRRTLQPLAEERPDAYCGVLNNLGGALQRSGRYGEAEEHFEEALQIRALNPGRSSLEYAQSANNLGSHYLRVQNYVEAFPLLNEALELRRTLLGEEDPAFATTLHNLASLHQGMAEFDEARTSLTQALKIRSQTLEEDHPAIAQSWSNLGTLEAEVRRYWEAERCYLKATGMLKRRLGERHPETAATLFNLGQLYARIGRLQPAEDHLLMAVEIRRERLGATHPDYLDALEALAVLRKRQGNLTEAEALLNEIFSIEEGSGSSRLVGARRLASLGSLYRQVGLHDMARRILLTGLRREEHSKADPDVLSELLNNLGTVYLATGESAASELVLERALRLRRQRFELANSRVRTTMLNLAIAYGSRGKLDEALSLVLETATVGEGDLLRQLRMTPERGRAERLGEEHRVVELLAAIAVAKADPDANAQLLELWFSRKLLGTNLSSTLRRRSFDRESNLVQARDLDRLRLLDAQIARTVWSDPPTENLESRKRSLVAWRSERDRIETRLAHTEPFLKSIDKPAPGAAEVSEALPAGSALVECLKIRRFDLESAAWGRPCYLGMVLDERRAGEAHIVDFGDSHRIEEVIKVFSQAQASEFCVKAWDDKSPAIEELRRVLLRPLLDRVGQGRRWFVAPDGALAAVPFEALAAEDQDVRVSYVASGGQLVGFSRRTRAPANLPFVGSNPLFTAPSVGPPNSELRRSFGSLGASGLEGDRIAKVLQVPNVQGAKLTKDLLLELESPRVLHLATHGFYLEPESLQSIHAPALSEPTPNMDPLLRSGLAVSRGGTDALEGTDADGLLLADEIAGMSLRDTELVVLSGCGTGLGDASPGDWIYGLRRAVAVAGAGAVVLSLWEVDDLATAILMDEFYVCLSSGSPKDVSLRKAQDRVRQCSVYDLQLGGWLTPISIARIAGGDLDRKRTLKDLVYGPAEFRPFESQQYWAGFILEGDPAPIF